MIENLSDDEVRVLGHSWHTRERHGDSSDSSSGGGGGDNDDGSRGGDSSSRRSAVDGSVSSSGDGAGGEAESRTSRSLQSPLLGRNPRLTTDARVFHFGGFAELHSRSGLSWGTFTLTRKFRNGNGEVKTQEFEVRSECSLVWFVLFTRHSHTHADDLRFCACPVRPLSLCSLSSPSSLSFSLHSYVLHFLLSRHLSRALSLSISPSAPLSISRPQHSPHLTVLTLFSSLSSSSSPHCRHPLLLTVLVLFSSLSSPSSPHCPRPLLLTVLILFSSLSSPPFSLVGRHVHLCRPDDSTGTARETCHAWTASSAAHRGH
jgi:hypothetical protein